MFSYGYIGCHCCCSLVVKDSPSLTAPLLLGFKAVNTIRLLHFVGELDKAHRSLCGATVLAGPGDRVADASVSQPAGVAAVVVLQLPRGKDVAHLGNLCAVIQARLHSLRKSQPLGLNQPIKTP